MQIQVGFDTEKEELADLKKLCGVLQTIIYRREGKLSLTQESINEAVYFSEQFAPVQESNSMHAPAIQGQFAAVSAPSYEQPVQAKKPEPKDMRTAGGGRVIPFDNAMASTMSRIYSGKKY